MEKITQIDDKEIQKCKIRLYNLILIASKNRILNYETIKLLKNHVSVNIILEAVFKINPFLPGKFSNLIVTNKPILILSEYYSENRRLLESDYSCCSEANDKKNKIEKIIESLFLKWNKNNNLTLDRTDLEDYRNEIYLKDITNSLK